MDLQPVDQWAHNYALWSLTVISPERVVVGDSLQSVTVLKWDSAKSKLEVVARDWTSLASMNVTADEDFVIQSDVSTPTQFQPFLMMELLTMPRLMETYYHIKSSLRVYSKKDITSSVKILAI